MDEHFKKFLELYNQIHINILLVEALSQMPEYATILKELLQNKRKLEEVSMATLAKECSVILQSKLPLKLKDLEGHVSPCLIGSCI